MRHRFAHACLVGGMLLGLTLSSHAQLGVALNATNLTWTTSGTGGASGWTAQSSTTHDGVSAAQSGSVSPIGPAQTSTLQTTVIGPGTLTFWWYTSFTDLSTLSCTANGISQASISGYGGWQQVTVYLGSGTSILRWINSNSTGGGRGYVDEVSYTNETTAPIITSQPPGQSQVPGLDVMFMVGAAGTPPLSYQWQLNETNILGATNYSLIVSNIQATNLGLYRVVITNVVGSLVSSNAPLEFGQVTAWGKVELPSWATVTNGATNILEVAAGWIHGMALKSDGNILAWGSNPRGELNVPADATNAIAITAGGGNPIALRADGTVVAWGAADGGATAVTNLPAGLTNVVAIAAGLGHGVALRANGIVTGWGNNFAGVTNVPADLTNVVAIAAGNLHTLALKANGTVATWGYNSLGLANVPSNLTNAVAIAGGSIHSLALRDNGTVVAWGGNSYGQTNVPAGLTNVVAVAAGFYHSVALKADGTVVAWGNNASGQTNVPVNLTNVVAISAFASQNLAIVGDSPPIQNALVSNPILSSNGFSLSLPSQSGRVYVLEYKNSPTDSNWTARPLVAGNGTNLVLTDSTTATNSARLYRVRRW